MEWLRQKRCWLLDFNMRIEKGDWAITATQIIWFIGLSTRGYNCVFPDDGNIAMVD